MTDQKAKKKAGIVFILKTIAVYALWVVVRKSMKGLEILYPIWVKINDFLAEIYIALSAKILQLWFIQEGLSYNNRNIVIDGTPGLYVGDHCLGIAAMFIFTTIIMVLKGKIFYKLVYIPIGILVIFIINLIRIILLAILLKNGSKAFFDLNHDYVFLVLVYGAIFTMIILWEHKLSEKT